MEFLSILTKWSTNGGETNRPFASIIFFAPEMGGYFLEANNFVPANPLVTPDHIAPVWYFHSFLFYFKSCPTNLK